MRKGRILRTGQELCKTVPLIRERKMEAELEQFRHDIEMAERAAGPLEGQHRGALAGLGHKEREEAIRRHMDELDREEGRDTSGRSILEASCLPGEPVFALRELVERMMRKDYQDTEEAATWLIEDYRLRGKQESDEMRRALEYLEHARSEERLEEAVEKTVERYLDPSYLQATIERLVEPQIERMRALAREGGHRACPDDSLPTPDDVPVPVDGLCYRFHANGSYHAVMPREVVPIALGLDWERALAVERHARRVAAFFECAADLRGVVEIDAAIDAFLSSFDDGTHTSERCTTRFWMRLRTSRFRGRWFRPMRARFCCNTSCSRCISRTGGRTSTTSTLSWRARWRTRRAGCLTFSAERTRDR